MTVLEAIRPAAQCVKDSLYHDHDTRAWLMQHGFKPELPITWEDVEGEAGTVRRHFRQDQR